MASVDKPSSPYKGKPIYHEEPPTATPIMYHTASTPLSTPYTVSLEPAESVTTTIGLCCLTAKLMVFHLLNFVLGTVGFCVVITGLCLAVGLLPLCLVGIPIYFGTLHLTRVLTLADIGLANMVTPSNAKVQLDVPDTEADDAVYTNELRIAPRLTRISMRSSVVVLYFATLKFALGIASAAVVSLPFLPIASQIVASNTSDYSSNYIAGWEVHSFNFSTNPVAYVFVCIGYIIGGLVLIHVFGIASRETTRFVCCTKTNRRIATATNV